ASRLRGFVRNAAYAPKPGGSNVPIRSLYGPAGRKAASWSSHVPLLSDAVACTAPADVEIASSTMSPSGGVITRPVKPEPAAGKVALVRPAAKRSSDGAATATAPLSAVVPLPLAEPPASNAPVARSPEYSVIRRSTNTAGCENVTVT